MSLGSQVKLEQLELASFLCPLLAPKKILIITATKRNLCVKLSSKLTISITLKETIKVSTSKELAK